LEELQEISDGLGCVLIFLSGSNSCPIQTVNPEYAQFSIPLLIGIGRFLMFYVTKPLPIDDPNREKDGICKCGRKVDLACDKTGCPCYDNKVACWKKDECKCQNCNNPYGSRWEISGFCLCQNERFLSFFSLYIFVESLFIFQFLNDKMQNYVKHNITVNFIIQKLKNKHIFLKIIQTEKAEEPLGKRT
jgi:hypothetical protein